MLDSINIMKFRAGTTIFAKNISKTVFSYRSILALILSSI